ncbi:hypothetical protein D3C72_2101580 [compost metagenome]
MAGCSSAALPRSAAFWFITRSMALFPNTDSQARVKPSGISSTPQTSSRTVRPREIRATNMPTKGAQEIHQAQ